MCWWYCGVGRCCGGVGRGEGRELSRGWQKARVGGSLEEERGEKRKIMSEV